MSACTLAPALPPLAAAAATASASTWSPAASASAAVGASTSSATETGLRHKGQAAFWRVMTFSMHLRLT